MSQLTTLLIDVARLILWLMLLAVVFIPLERLYAVRQARIARPGLAADVGLYFLNSLFPAAILAMPLGLIAAAARHLQPEWWSAAITGLPFAVQVVLAFIVAEIGFYWGHRWSHEWRWLWRFHRVHHTPETLDWLVNTRANPVDIVFTRLCGLVPLYATGLSQPSANGSLAAVLVILAGTVWGFFIHANIGWRLGIVEQIVATPRFHHWHHVRSGPINRNYAAMLPLVDRLFATVHLPPKVWPEAYGVDQAVETPPAKASRAECGPIVG